MASPTIETFCCLHPNNSESESLELLLHFDAVPYNIVCLLTSAVGVLGAVYQIFAIGNEEKSRSRNVALSVLRQRVVIRWLAIADILSSSGVFLRALSWLISKEMMLANPQQCPSTALFCAIISGWIQCFYIATYFWTFFYAVDVLLTIYDREANLVVYHSVTWCSSGLLTFMGLIIMYYPNLDCHRNDPGGFWYTLPNYLFTYIPILVVLILNPIMYKAAFKRIGVHLARNRGKMTIREYKLIDIVRIKFFFINLSFYICWLPNIINGLILWLSWASLPKTLVATLWYMMAVVNPLQGLLNALVYRHWEKKASSTYPVSTHSSEISSSPSTNGLTEKEPLTKALQPGYSSMKDPVF